MKPIHHRPLQWGLVLAVAILAQLPRIGEAAENRGYKAISVNRFVEMMKDKDFVLINVHVPYEGEIPGTDLVIPFHAIDRHQDELPTDKGAKIVVYCMTGPMGDRAAGKLVEMGYTNVMNLRGGMKAWKEKTGKPLVFRRKSD
jgi:rhodanese-related sulfurtransferase